MCADDSNLYPYCTKREGKEKFGKEKFEFMIGLKEDDLLRNIKL